MTQLDMTFAENQDWQKSLLGWFENTLKFVQHEWIQTFSIANAYLHRNWKFNKTLLGHS